MLKEDDDDPYLVTGCVSKGFWERVEVNQLCLDPIDVLFCFLSMKMKMKVKMKVKVRLA